jgi:hypothetical protein
MIHAATNSRMISTVGQIPISENVSITVSFMAVRAAQIALIGAACLSTQEATLGSAMTIFEPWGEWPILSKPAVRQGLRKRRDLAISRNAETPLSVRLQWCVTHDSLPEYWSEATGGAMWHREFLCALALSFGAPFLAEAAPPQTSVGSFSGEKLAIHNLITRYYDAVAKNPAASADFYGQPTLLVTSTEVTMLPKKSDIQAFLTKTIGALKPLGYSRSDVADPRIAMLNDTTAMYSAVAIRFASDGREMQRAGFTYLLHKGPAGWRIHELVATDLDKLLDPR